MLRPINASQSQPRSNACPCGWSGENPIVTSMALTGFSATTATARNDVTMMLPKKDNGGALALLSSSPLTPMTLSLSYTRRPKPAVPVGC